MTTTAEIEDRAVREYLGIVSGEAVMTIPRDAGSETSAKPRVRSKSLMLEQQVREIRSQAIAAMAKVAGELGASAIVAIDIDYTIVQQAEGDDLLYMIASGTAVTLQ